MGDSAGLSARAHLHLLAPTRFRRVELGEASDDPALAGYMSMRALLLRDLEELRDLASRAPSSLAWVWLAFAEGRYEDAAGRLASIPKPDSSEARSVLLGASSAIHLASGRRAEALDAARSAARIARTDGGRLAQCFAYLNLGRVRRACGQRHRALHILGSLSKAASSLWRERIAWEKALAASPDEESEPGRLLLGGGLLSLPALDFASDRDDCIAIQCALDPDSSPSPLLAPFLEGRQALPPATLAGVCGSTFGESRSLLVVLPSGCRRVCLWADARCSERGRGLELQGRTALAVASLALEPSRVLSRDEFFRRVYGQSYAHERHRNVVKTLMHRIRVALGEVAGCVREEDGFSLRVDVPFWFRDPTGETSVEERVLAELAEQSGPIHGISKSLGLSRRSVQNAAAALKAKGVIRKREQNYVIVDTTFTEPTHWPTPLPSDES